MPIEDFLFPSEQITSTLDERNLVKYAKTPHRVYFTNQRILLYARTGLVMKRDSVVSIAYDDVIKLDYRERGFIKKGFAIVVTPLQKYEFEGDTIAIKELIKNLQKFIPTRSIEAVKERETIIKEKETVLIPCSYCGQLIPQTSVFCPNCGAKRKV